MFNYELKIPKERIAVLIGTKGETKKKIEEETKTNIEIDSKEGDVVISGEDAILLYTARNIVRAIGRGFNPELALLLLKQDYSFEIIPLNFENPNQLKRIRGRVIGKNGRSREIIEEMTESYVSVYGKTISIIGTIESVINAKRAIEMLIKGSPHSNVYKWLEKRRREQKKREYEEFYIKRDNIDI
ncbi:MAG: KH domain-containing protein [Candidatus Woesearchaeota archaeon]